MAEKQIVPSAIRVLMPNGRVQEMKLETYLAGAVAMAIGTSAPLEALKAQAVASRTYAARAKRHADHTADVCTTAHCQKWNRVDPIVAPEVFRAVSETWGTVALYGGELIEAFFFEHCAGKTRDAEEMAMTAFPYLRSIECGCGFTGMKGHGVGMCQRGAIVMARQGNSFKDILKHYYRGVEVVQTRSDAPPVPKEAKPVPKAEPKKARGTLRTKKPAPVVNLAKDGLAALIEALNQAAATLTPNQPSESAPPSTPSKPAVEHKSLPPPAIPTTMSTESQAEPVAPSPSTPVLDASSVPIASALVSDVSPVTEKEKDAAPVHGGEVIHVDMLPGPRVIAGCLQHAGVQVEIEDMRGNKTTVYTGSAPHYGEGGFEALVEADGFYTVTVDGKIIEVNLHGETAFLRGKSV